MTVYAMSSIASINVGAGHGGCGQPHQRPLGAGGLPVQPWALSCGLCETHLRKDTQMWALSVAEIPSTFDEVRQREQLAVRSGADRDNFMMVALAKIAGIDLRELSATAGVPALTAAAVPGLVACPSCNGTQAAGGAYCAACGASMRGPAPAIGSAA